MTMKGGCLCGAVRFEAKAEPLFAGNCYCTDCQKGGSGHVTVAAVPTATLTVSGAPATYTKKGGSGQDITRFFCPTCGSTLFSQPAAMEGMSMLRASVLDDPASVTPAMSIYAKSAAPWDRPPTDIPAFPEAPPRG